MERGALRQGGAEHGRAKGRESFEAGSKTGERGRGNEGKEAILRGMERWRGSNREREGELEMAMRVVREQRREFRSMNSMHHYPIYQVKVRAQHIHGPQSTRYRNLTNQISKVCLFVFLLSRSSSICRVCTIIVLADRRSTSTGARSAERTMCTR